MRMKAKFRLETFQIMPIHEVVGFLDMQVGNLFRWLNDMFGINGDDFLRKLQPGGKDDDKPSGVGEPKSFFSMPRVVFISKAEGKC